MSRRWVILPDVHVPYHDVKLMRKVCKAVADVKPHGLVISGDFLDMKSLSKHDEGSLERLRGVTLSGEYEAGRVVLKQVVRSLPRYCERWFIYGNHEDRYLRTMARGDTAKFGGELRSPEAGLGLKGAGFRVLRNWRDDSVRIGKHLEVIHGIYTPEHVSHKHLRAFDGSVIMGHSHRFGAAVEGRRGGYNIGFLGDMNSPGFAYMPRPQRRRWVNGFAVVHEFPDGDFLVNAIQCWNGRFVCEGKVY